MKKLTAIILAILMLSLIAAAFPVSASAATEYYLWVNGERITSDHLTVKGTSVDGKDGGTAVFNPNTNTLTLNSITITSDAEYFDDYAGILSREANLTVVVKGRCVISTDAASGICLAGQTNWTPNKLTIKGDGKSGSELIVTPYDDDRIEGVACLGGEMTIDGVRLTIDAPGSGIYTDGGQVTIQNNAVVYSKSQNESGLNTYGGSILVKGGDVTFENKNNIAMQLNNYNENASTLIVQGGSVTVTGRMGLYGGNQGKAHVTVTGGTLDITGTATDVFSGNGMALVMLGESSFTLGGGVKVVEGDYQDYHIRFSSKAPSVMLGDADGDNVVTVLDATAVQKKLASVKVPKFIEAAADADEDKSITILDATAIQKWLAKIPTNDRIGKMI